MSVNIVMNSSNNLKLQGLINEFSGSFENSATVSYVLTDSENTTIDNGTMLYDTGSSGDYYATISHTVTLIRNARYNLVITADNGVLVREFVDTAYARIG